VINRPAVLYYGSKWRIATKIIRWFPPHKLYCEPYAGSGGVLLQKAPSFLEVYNDADRAIVNFFRQLRERPDELIRLIELTPHSRTELDLAYESCDDPMEGARRYYVRAWQSRGANARWHSGWRYDVSGRRGKSFTRNWSETYHLWDIVQRLRCVQIECGDALDVIRRFDGPETLFYVDPPYPRCVRAQGHIVEYTIEMSGSDVEEEQSAHEQLSTMLHRVAGGVIISSYHSALYDALYEGWEQVEIAARTRSNAQATEVLWLSPRIQEMRLPLFRLTDDDWRRAYLGDPRVTKEVKQ
jgi:DNA adenine methylase